MNLLESLEKEVSDAADQMAVEVVLLLIDKAERDFEAAIASNQISADELLGFYVRLKISLHHLMRRYERDWFYDLSTQHEAEARIMMLRGKVKEARVKYYVAKQRYESDKHGDGCSCRGCRCIKGIDWGSSNQAGQGAY